MPDDARANLELEFLPARQGDAIWIRWGTPEASHQLIVDMGTKQTGRLIHERLLTMPKHLRRFELLVNTHVDSDHIAGVLSCVSHPHEPISGIEFGDVWFNGRDHLEGRRVPEPPQGLESWGPAQGQQFADWLKTRRWNQHFDRGPVVSGSEIPRVELPGGLAIDVLGPTQRRLTDLIGDWDAIVDRELSADDTTAAPAGLESYGTNPEPFLTDWTDLADLALTDTDEDIRPANGSSIALLLRWHGRTALLCGDAFPVDIVDALTTLGDDRPDHVDVVKLPHHGSKKNVTIDLVQAIDSSCWVFSTDGSVHKHPDSVAVARVIHCRRDNGPTELVFNVPSDFNKWWDRDDFRTTFGYATTYGTAEAGATITLTQSDEN